MTDAERRPMQRMIATGPRFARKGHGRPQEGLRDARQCLPSRKPGRGSSAWLRQHLRKPRIAERLDLSKPHIPPCQQKVSTRGWCGRQSRPHQSCLVLCDESAKKHNDGSSPEFSEQYARAREAGIGAGIHEIGICIAVLVTRPVTTETRNACRCGVTDENTANLVTAVAPIGAPVQA